MRCWTHGVPNATFVPSADRKATRSVDEQGKVSIGVSFFHARLCAERPRLIAALMLAALVVCHCSTRADEPAKLALASTNPSPSVPATNAVKPAVSAVPTSETNALTLAFIKPVAVPSLPAVRPEDSKLAAPITVVIEKKATTGFFSGQSGNGSFGFANIEAGYGQAYDSDSIVLRGRNGTVWEETRYIFFKKVVKF